MSTSTALAGEEPPIAALDRAVLVLFLASLVLLPWAWFPPFPWLHEHAQWSDPVFAAAALCWAAARCRDRRWPRFGPALIATGAYLVAASLSFLFSLSHESAGAWKLLGIAELTALALITTDLASK